MSQLCGSGLTRRSYVTSAARVGVATASAMQAMIDVEIVVRMLALPSLMEFLELACPGRSIEDRYISAREGSCEAGTTLPLPACHIRAFAPVFAGLWRGLG